MCVQVCVCLCGFTLNCLQPVIPAAGQAKPNLSALCLSPSLTAAHIPHESKLKAVHSSARGAKNESIAFELLSHIGIGICMCWYTETLAWRKSLSFYYALSQLFWTAEFAVFFLHPLT